MGATANICFCVIIGNEFSTAFALLFCGISLIFFCLFFFLLTALIYLINLGTQMNFVSLPDMSFRRSDYGVNSILMLHFEKVPLFDFQKINYYSLDNKLLIFHWLFKA